MASPAEAGLSNDKFQQLKDIVIEIALVAQSRMTGA
jgi:hypothetical protein